MKKIAASLGVVAAIFCMVATGAMAKEVKRTATISDITGEAHVKLATERSWMSVVAGMTLTEGDTIKTDKGAWILLKLEGDVTATVEIGEESQLLLRQFVEDKELNVQKTLLDLALGEIMIQAEQLSPESKFEVKTPSSVAGVRGTKFAVKVEAVE